MQSIIKINGFNDGYGVSSDGKVFTFKQGRNREVKQHEHKGYKRVFLFNENKRKSFFVHRLVALHFIPAIVGKDWVNHKDGDKSNNDFSNLEWCSREENQKHSREVLGNTGRGAKNNNYGYRISKLYPSQSLRNQLVKLGVPRSKHNLAELGEMLPINHISTQRDSDSWWLSYTLSNPTACYVCSDVTEANARAKMLIWLIENKYLANSKVEE